MADTKKKRRIAVEKVPVKGPKGNTGWAVLYDDGMLRIDWVRFSYPHLNKPFAGEDDNGNKQEPKYGVVGMLPKKGNKAAKALIDKRIEEILAEAKVRKLPAEKLFIRDGDESGKEEQEGMWCISTRETNKPPLRKRDNTTPTEAEARELFLPGYWGSMLIRPWWQNHTKYGKRVNSGISSVQFLMKDDTFGQGRISDEDLDDAFESYDDYEDPDDEDEDDRPAKRRRARDDDYDDDDDKPAKKPKKRRPVDDDDDDDDI